MAEHLVWIAGGDPPEAREPGRRRAAQESDENGRRRDRDERRVERRRREVREAHDPRAAERQ